MNSTPRRWMTAGGILMILLGLARGAGGVVLLFRGAAADPKIQAPAATVSLVGAGLLLLGLVVLIGAVGVLRGQRWGSRVGIAGSVAFVVDGAINGFLLYGNPTDRGTIANLGVAGLIILCLCQAQAGSRRDGGS